MLITLIIITKSERRNREFKRWIAVILQAQITNEEGQMLHYGKVDVPLFSLF